MQSISDMYLHHCMYICTIESTKCVIINQLVDSSNGPNCKITNNKKKEYIITHRAFVHLSALRKIRLPTHYHVEVTHTSKIHDKR